MTPSSPLPPVIAAHLATGLLIDGLWRPAFDRATFPVEDPATGEVIADVADARAADALDALGAADAAAPAWRAVAPRERAEALRAVHDRLMARADTLSAVITAESGKPIAEARAEVAYGADFVRWYSEQAVRAAGSARTAPSGGSHQIVLRRAVGPVLAITPWNFPLAMATRKVAPALAAGCTVVVKPARLAPLTTALFAEIVREVLAERGLPAGVLNVVPSSSAAAVSEPLLTDPRLRKLSFTGSTEVGRTLLRQAADRVLRTSMELGGDAPFLVFEDADVEAAVEGALAAKLRNAGQTCVAANRFLVHERVAEEFTGQLTAAFEALVVGPGTVPGTDVGPLIEAAAVDAVHELVTADLDAGARLRTGGTPSAGPGHFYPPTVLTGLERDAATVTHEVFGPVAPVLTFTDEEEAVALANAGDHGLAAYAFTTDVRRVFRLAEQIEAGMLGVNRGMVSDASAPFGGVKASGLGREGGEAGIEEYLETVYVSL